MINNKLVYLAIVALILSSAVFGYSLHWQNSIYPGVNLTTKILQPFATDSLLVKAVPQVQTQSQAKYTTTSLFFAGDIMLDRNVLVNTKKTSNYDYPLAKFLLPEKFDLRIANLEGPITNNLPYADPHRMSFTFSPRFLPALKDNFEILNLANNHTDNFGKKGLTQTREYLATSSIQYFGDPNNQQTFLSTSTTLNGIKIGLVGYNQLVNIGFDDVLSEVRSLKSEVNFVVVYPHWGAEYQTEKPTALQVSEAHQLIDAGADLIIGSHSHVIEPIEEYKGKMIFYSLGNFIFDQYFSPETQQGLTVGIYLTKDSEGVTAEYKLWPVQISNSSQVSIANDIVREQILQNLAKLSNVSTSTREGIKVGEF